MNERPPRIVKFVNVAVTELGSGRCSARVELSREPNRSYFGTATGPCGDEEQLLLVAQATANALVQAAAGSNASGYEIRVNEIDVQEAFGRPTVLVSVAGSYFNQRRNLLGLCYNPDLPRAAALAVLNATNRFMGVG
jgi:hypothetical protein